VGITEYSWGADSHINGATAQADVLGIFGREGLDLAARWTAPNRGTPAYNAMRIVRNYDGRGAAFGDVSVGATVPNPDAVSAFAAVRSSDRALTIMIINKALRETTAADVRLANYAAAPAAQRWQLTAQNVIERIGDVLLGSGTMTLDLPPQSITLLVVPSLATMRRRAVH
jgi:hypothetical protein